MAVDRQPEHHRAEELILENEARIRLDLDGAFVGLFEWNVVTNQSQWSTGFYLLHGLQPGAPANYQLWRDQVHPDDLDRVEAELKRAVDAAEYVDTAYRIVHPDGEVRWTSLQAKVQHDSDGQPLVMTGYCGDITRRKLADAALLESEKLAIAGRMSAAIAHEINNPLEAAFNLLYLARGIASQSEQAILLDQTLEQLRRVAEICRQTLRFSRPTQPRLVKVVDVVEATLRLVGAKLRLGSLEAIIDCRGNCELWCSPGELQQILTNILNNAAEASLLPRTVTIRVRHSIDWEHRKTSGLRITVADGGPGMTPETLRRLREPFFTTKEGTGTGLGMWVVQELVTKLEGRISMRTSTRPSSHGTAISLFFPTANGKNA
jgi:PAS domain S-box-containing protein